LRFQALPDEITACHSSLGGEFGEWVDVVKDARRARAGKAGAIARCLRRAFFRTPCGILDNIESTSPIMLGPLNELPNPTLTGGSNPDLYTVKTPAKGAFGHVAKTGDRSSRLNARGRRVAALPPRGKTVTEISATLSTDYTTSPNIVPTEKLKLRPTHIAFAVELKRRPQHDVRATARLPHSLESWRVLLIYTTRPGAGTLDPAGSRATAADDTTGIPTEVALVHDAAGSRTG
jgi:hypothetical protein